MTWRSVTARYEDTGALEYHVVPNDDLREHDDWCECWCKPTPDDEVPNLFVHHSLDKREEYEEGRLTS